MSPILCATNLLGMLLTSGTGCQDPDTTLPIEVGVEISVELVAHTFGLIVDDELYIRGERGIIMYPSAPDGTGVFTFPGHDKNWKVHGNGPPEYVTSSDTDLSESVSNQIHSKGPDLKATIRTNATDAVNPYKDKQWSDVWNFLSTGEVPSTLRDAKSSKRCSWRYNIRRKYELDRDINRIVYIADNKRVKPATSFPARLRRTQHDRRVCVPGHEARSILTRMHNEQHDARFRIEARFAEDYKAANVRAITEEIRNNCRTCSEWKSGRPAIAQAIITHRPMQILMFDLAKMPMTDSTNGHNYILLVKDHF